MGEKCEKCGGTLVADWVTAKSYVLDCPACIAQAQLTAELKDAVVSAARKWSDRPSTYHDSELYENLDAAVDALEEHLKEVGNV